jgi:Uncharacterized protein conserved in bacteria (DUF2188)
MAKNSAASKGGSVTTASSKKRKKKFVTKYLHVAYRRPEGWIIYNENYRTLSIHNTRREAVEVARPLAMKNEITLVIHRRDNRVMKWEHYNREPMPPPKPPKVLYPTDPPRTATREAIRRAVIAAINKRRLANELKG